MKILSPILILTFCLLVSTKAYTQSKASPREMFLEAESYFLYEEYSEALPLYLKLSVIYPDNENLNYKLGRCYLNIPYEKEKSIEYLEQASKKINPNYKGDNLKETAAPPDVIFYLGDAYRINNQLEKAVQLYKRFELTSDPAVFDHDMIEDHIRACENAMKLMKHPLNIEYTHLGDVINSRFPENNAVISGDESVMLFAVKLQFYTAVFFSVKENNTWGPPVNINPDLGVDNDCIPVGISYDGKELFLYRSNEFLGDLFVSRYANGKWSKIRKLNSHINTKYWESHACISRDGKRLYFTSNRKGGIGGLDIYISTRKNTESDDWGPARNLGSVVNSPLNEETPFITSDDKKLFFSSLGHNGIGGYDIFVSESNKDGAWGKPQNLGYPLNTTDHDLFFHPAGDGSEGYMALYRNNTLGRSDIYRLKITRPSPVALATINETLKEPEQPVPSSEVNKSILRTDQPDNSVRNADFFKQVVYTKNQRDTSKQANPVQSTDSLSAFATPPPDTIVTHPDEKPVIQQVKQESDLSPGQKQAWHKLLYGSLAILAVFLFFVLILIRRSRKNKNRKPEN